MFTAYFPFLASLVVIFFAGFLVWEIRKIPAAKNGVSGIFQLVRQSIVAYFSRQGRIVLPMAALIFLLLLFWGWRVATGFAIGLAAGALMVFLGVFAALETSQRAIEEAKKGPGQAFALMARGGMAQGLLMSGAALLAAWVCYSLIGSLSSLIGAGLGVSFAAMVISVGGGIYTKAADVGGDLGINPDIAENDLRNPAVVSDLAGDIAGDCAGSLADSLQTYVIGLTAPMLLGNFLYPNRPVFVLLPLLLAGIAQLASIAASFMIRLPNFRRVTAVISKTIGLAAGISAVCFLPLIVELMHGAPLGIWNLYGASICGLAVGLAVFFIAQYYVSPKFRPVKSIAKAGEAGHATHIMTGLSVGMQAVLFPVLVVGFGVLVSFWLAGVYGLSIAAVCAISLSGVMVGLKTYAPVADSVAGVGKAARLAQESLGSLELLDREANTVKTMTRMYLIASWAMVLLALFLAYAQQSSYLQGSTSSLDFPLSDPVVLLGVIAGGAAIYLFLFFVIRAVGETASKIIAESRRQFKNISGLVEGLAKPDYSKCADIAGKAASRRTIVLLVIALAFPVLVGWLFGIDALGGFLVGSLVVGIFSAMSQVSSGAAWHSAKRLVESGRAAKQSLAWQAAVTGDALGDLQKDAAGPALGPLLKTFAVVSLLIAVFLV